MSDDTPKDETQPVRAEGTPATSAADADADAPAPAPDAAGPGTGRRGFRERLRSLRRSEGGDRTFGLAALIASALAGIIVGGLGSATFHAVTDDHDRDRDRGGWMLHRDGDGDKGFGGRGGMHGGPRGVPGQVPPTTAPEGESSAG